MPVILGTERRCSLSAFTGSQQKNALAKAVFATLKGHLYPDFARRNLRYLKTKKAFSFRTLLRFLSPSTNLVLTLKV
jgi:hypothetical protein